MRTTCPAGSSSRVAERPASASRRAAIAALLATAVGPALARGPADAALLDAASRGDLDGVRRALAAGASVAARDAQQRTALLAATYGNHPAVARALIDAGADPNAQDSMRNSAFLLAGARGHLEILRMTLAAGADLRSVNRYGGTALIPACHYGHVETVRELLKTAIDVDHVNDLGWTALLEAVILGDGGAAHVEIVRLLLERGASPSIADRDGVTPLAHARRRGQAAIERLLVRAGAR
ncbi:MAG TPA: ankyrin repeat domain-containing protein [Burkholderiaceae bacterium]|nr:ankyrin repeat domain-containing protein [Burkholderiaceae bacterium]